MSLNIKIEFNDAMIAELMRIPDLLRLGPAERCLNAMAKPIIAKAKDLAPSSRGSGSRRKWSAKLKNDTQWSSVDSARHMGARAVKHNRGARIYVGAQYPKGNKQQFGSPKKGRRVFYWGKDAGMTLLRPRDHFMQRAYDQTRGEQMSAFNTQLAKEIKELRIG